MAASKAFVVLGPAGGGKTHLFARMRHAGLRPTLVLLRPYFGVSLTLRDVLAVVVDQLCLPARGEARTQLDALASHWVEAHAAQDRAESVEKAVGAIVERLPEIAPAAHLVRALLALNEEEPSARWSELAWLSGREPRAVAKGGAAVLSDRDVLHMLRVLALLAAPAAHRAHLRPAWRNLAGDDESRVLSYRESSSAKSWTRFRITRCSSSR